ncbi:hypothetical protein [Thermosipho atlanticus]|uniref:Uncharacterized protein n=1 Tax=Thermosipho atlanticus DSM 15807 TaxID=1123380 RepID=A0A1M5SQE0_9BACT|nr:hypothetical protein [Thermosipho atlanticus]SHH40741.1 hypothetical protein SAMN02745199_1014 [Thermosipho atlanticus DSM 15807]
MRKILLFVIAIILFIFPFVLYSIDRYQTINEFKSMKSILDTEIKNYDLLIKELIKYKEPDGYVIEGNKIYYKGNLYEKSLEVGGYVILELDDASNLFYVSNSKLFSIPRITSEFIIYDLNGKIITENNFSIPVYKIFPSVKENITFYKGRRIYYEKISYKNGLNAIVYIKVPVHHLLLYFVFIPFGIFLLYEIAYINKMDKKEIGRNKNDFDKNR